MLKKIIFSFLLGLLWIPTFAGMTGKVLADDNTTQQSTSGQQFASSYDVTYDVGDDGITTVTEKINLKNLTSQYYATEFKLTIGATNITDVKASDSSGEMDTKIDHVNTSTIITVEFNQQIVGLNKELPWTLQFKSKDFAEKEGKVWDISVPKVSSSTLLESYSLTLSVPATFGEPTLISPEPKDQTTDNSKRFMTFDKDQLLNSGVSATFGNNQIYDFNLSYHLENPGLVQVLTSVALPPDTGYQDVTYQRIDPAPANVTVDDDGNYLAWYKLDPNQKLDVTAIGSAKLYSISKIKNPTLSASLISKYTANAKYWEKDDPAIKLKLSEILGSNPPQGNRDRARLIYRYVVGYLRYDPSRLNGPIDRYGAVAALNNPSSAVCMEFTDLFIALARAAGIPTRELDGFAYTSNSTLRPSSLQNDVLHAWPEYWDEQKGWVMIDPTWENTTGGVDYFDNFDLNHFVFVVKGSSSELPLPAGSYKYPGTNSKDVQVTISDVDFLGKPELDVNIDTADPILAGLSGQITMEVSNKGNALQQSVPLKINSNQLNILDISNDQLGPIPAFGHADFSFNFRTKSLFQSFNDVITAKIDDQIFTKDVTIRPFLLFQFFPLGLIIIFGIILGIYGIVLGVFIYRRKYKSTKLSNSGSQTKGKKE